MINLEEGKKNKKDHCSGRDQHLWPQLIACSVVHMSCICSKAATAVASPVLTFGQKKVAVGPQPLNVILLPLILDPQHPEGVLLIPHGSSRLCGERFVPLPLVQKWLLLPAFKRSVRFWQRCGHFCKSPNHFWDLLSGDSYLLLVVGEPLLKHFFAWSPSVLS